MLTRATDAPPFFSDHYATGSWDGGQWLTQIGLAVLALVVIGWIIPPLIGWLQGRWDELATWVWVVGTIFIAALAVAAVVVLCQELYEILNHLPATSFRGKFWKVAGVVILSAGALAAALWRVWDEALLGGTDSRADLIPIGVGVVIPLM